MGAGHSTLQSPRTAAEQFVDSAVSSGNVVVSNLCTQLHLSAPPPLTSI
jgi:hypothetical protein